jgi:diguanylate cyclase (GGDEF)-like protein
MASVSGMGFGCSFVFAGDRAESRASPLRDPPSGEWEGTGRGGTMRGGAIPRAPGAKSLPERAPDIRAARLRSYETLIDVSRMLLSSASLEELFERVTTELRRVVGYDAVTIYGVDEVRGLVEPLHSVDMWADEIMASPLRIGDGLTGWAIEHCTAENLPAAHSDPRIQVVPGTPPDEREALVVVPLVVRGRPIGALNAYRLGEFTAFSEDEFDLIKRFADLVALALDNTRIRHQLEQEAQTDFLTGLGNHRLFHERLRREMERAERYRHPLSLIVFDLDDFKFLNDLHGHQEGDLVLRRVAVAASEELRTSDIACRIGGEEFAILLPETGKRAARAAAERLCSRVRELSGGVRATTVSCGVASYPGDAPNVTEFLAAADAALYAAKDRGKDRAASYTAGAQAGRGRTAGDSVQLESLKQLRLLSGLAGKLNRLNDVAEIGRTIVADLAGMVDYHNARVYVLDEDGRTLEPVAFRGSADEYEGETLDGLRVTVGEGITGAAAKLGKTMNVPDATACPFAAQIPGTADLDESILAVPLMYDRRATGVLVLAKLGLNQFSPLAVRQVELLAAHAAVALENARLLADERRAAATAEALLDIATAASREASPQVVARRVVAAASRIDCAAGAALVVERDGRHRVLAACGDSAARSVALAVARGRGASGRGVSVVPTDDLPALSISASEAVRAAAHAAVHDGTLVVVGDRFGQAACKTIAAIAGQGALALQNAALLQRVREGYPDSLRRSS